MENPNQIFWPGISVKKAGSKPANRCGWISSLGVNESFRNAWSSRQMVQTDIFFVFVEGGFSAAKKASFGERGLLLVRLASDMSSPDHAANFKRILD
jgi:hypothetical protein